MYRFEFGIHLPVDDLREWVCGGLASPVGWTDETTRQFSLAEEGAADLALRYHDAGFAVAIDHCQGPPTLDALVARRFPGRPVHKVAVAPDLETNLRRNAERTGKGFESSVLVPTIHRLNPLYRASGLQDQGWIVIDNSDKGPDDVVDLLLKQTER